MASHHRPASNRFLSRPELDRSRSRAGRASAPGDLFAEGQWQVIRAGLESQGWGAPQIAMVYDQLRQGWPLALAKRNVALLTGHCPIGSRRDG